MMLKEYLIKYPQSTIQDILKLLYQCEFGSNHMIEDQQYAYNYLKEECSQLTNDDYEIEDIGDEYIRFHLFNASEIQLKTIHQLFVLSCKENTNMNDFLIKLKQLKHIYPNYKEDIDAYINKGCPMLRHSEQYRQAYHPHYRIMKKKYFSYYPLLYKINETLYYKKDIIIGIDGMCGAGKSSLALLLQSLYDIQLFCMDDFFLQKHQRTKERYETPGENIDHERFLKEVLLPLKNKEDVNYRRFVCQSMSVEDIPEKKVYKPITVIEGTYCLHPLLRQYIDYSVVLMCDKKTRLERLKNRNSEFMYKMFIDKWIPLETLYFNYYHIADICDLLIKDHSCY